MRVLTAGAIAMLLGLGIGCGKPATEEAQKRGVDALMDKQLVLAETRLGPITVADLDRYILALPPAQRPDARQDRKEQYTAILRRLAIDALLLDEATLVGADQDPEFRWLERRIQRNASSDWYLSTLPPADPIDIEEAREVYDAAGARYQREEKRRVSHIYKRFAPEEDQDQTVAALEDLRQRLLAGESFELLARDHSDSETRHNGGLIGEIKRGQFTEDFDQVVFALEERIPSEPVVTADGAHIFLVRDIFEARDFSFEEMRFSIIQELEAKRRGQRLKEAAEALPQPKEIFTPGPQEIGQILRLGDPATVVLRLGNFALTIGQFQEILQSQRRLLGAQHVPDFPIRLLEEIRHREIIFQHLEAKGLDTVPQERLHAERDRELALYFARRKMTSWVERRPELMQHHYDNNRMRFASPLRLRLSLLSIPLTDEGPAVMADLEAARQELDAGNQQMEKLATAHGGDVKDLGFVGAAQVQAMSPRAMQFVFLLKPGEHSPPYVLGKRLVMYQVVERQDPQARPLALVRDAVVQDYLTNYSAEVFAKLSEEMLEEAGFRVYDERLASLGAG